MELNTISFEDSIQLARKKAFSDTQKPIGYLISDLNRFIKYIKKIQDQNPDLSPDQLSSKLVDDFHFNLTTKVFESGYSFEHYMDLNSCKYLQKHPGAFDMLWDLISQDPDYEPKDEKTSFLDYLEDYVYSVFVKNDSITDYARCYFDPDMMKIVRKYASLENTPENQQRKFKELEKYIRSSFSTRMGQNAIIDCAKIECFGPKYFLRLDQKILEKNLKEDLSSSVLELIRTLDETGAYERCVSVNDRNLRKFQFIEFQTSPNGTDLYPSIKDLPNYLASLDIDDLMILNTFWLNRYTKEVNSYGDCLSTIRELDLLDKILSASRTPEDFISEAEYRGIAEKKALLRPLIADYIVKAGDEASEKRNAEEYKELTSDKEDKEIDSKTYVTFSYEPLKEVVSDPEFIEEYKNYFDTLLPKSDNDPRRDIIFYANIFNPSVAAYSQKSDCLSALITNIESNPQIVNSGIIPDSYSPDQTHVNLKYFVGLGIDAKLSYPVREHITLEFLKDFLKSYTGSTMIPIYEGADDFRNPFEPNSRNSFVSAQLVLPFSTKQTELLKKITKTNGYSKYNKKFIQHMNFLINPKRIPDSFFTDVELPNGKTRKVFERRYVDLEDGQIYTKDKSGNYLPVAPSLKKGFDELRDYDK